MTYISGSTKFFLSLLEQAFEYGFTAGFWTEDNPADYVEDWEEFKSKYLKEFTDEPVDEEYLKSLESEGE